MGSALVVAAIVLLIVSVGLWAVLQGLRRDAYIRSFTLPYGLFDKLRQRHPSLTTKDCQLVAAGLRQFFLAYRRSGRQYVSMPSQVVDDLWHEFILHTRAYDAFCRKAFGGFLHHTPAVALGKAQQGNAGLRRTWWHACREENIDPRKPTRLPLLFALDAKLKIAGGFIYVTNCDVFRAIVNQGDATSPHCGGDFSSTSYDGGTDGMGDGAGDGDGGDGGGGDGCGGGCGGD